MKKDNLLLPRLCIYPNEIALILGKSENTAQKLVRTIKDANQKKLKRPLTIKEFCEYMDLPYEEVYGMINKKSA